MKTRIFMQDNNFLLSNPIAEKLYNDVAQHLPIIDYHNHLSPKDICENRKFNNLTEIWLDGDHYKWRAMRANGVSEEFITGKASPLEKFQKWAETVPYTLRNPLYHWTHMELRKPFSINKLLNPENAKLIFDDCNEKLQTNPNFRVQGLLAKWNVESLCTTDDPLDDLRYHKEIKRQNSCKTKVLPTFRADNFLRIDEFEFIIPYFKTLENLENISINSFQNLCESIEKRHDYFHKVGCRVFDVSLKYAHVIDYTEKEVDEIINKVLLNNEITNLEIEKYRSAILHYLGGLNHDKDWVQQFHIGPLRNNNTNLMKLAGSDAGCDSLDDLPQAQTLSKFFNRFKKENKLAKTVLYNLNPKDNAVFATMIGNFNDNSSPGKLQYGAGWWFLDQKEGIISQLNTVSNFGLLRRFIGMLTDSRSFLSFSRHEYFRRILCDVIGRDVMNGEIPNDFELLSKMVEEICYLNAKNYFK